MDSTYAPDSDRDAPARTVSDGGTHHKATQISNR